MRPVLFRLGGVPVYAFGTLLLGALVVGLVAGLILAQRRGISRKSAALGFLVWCLGAALGGKLYPMVASLGADGGPSLAAFSGYAGGAFGLGAIALWARWTKRAVAGAVDVAAAGAALGGILPPLGCYLFGCHFGDVLGPHAPVWLRALGTFPRWEEPGLSGAPALVVQIHHGLVPAHAEASLPVHPTQLYELVALAVVALVAALTFRGSPGTTAVVVVVGTAIARVAAGLLWFEGDALVPPLGQRAILVVVAVATTLLFAFTRAGAPEERRPPRIAALAAATVALATALIAGDALTAVQLLAAPAATFALLVRRPSAT